MYKKYKIKRNRCLPHYMLDKTFSKKSKWIQKGIVVFVSIHQLIKIFDMS